MSLDERYALREWKAPLRLNFMTPLRVDVSPPGEVRLRADSANVSFVVRYDAARFDATTEEIPIADARLLPIWGSRIARVVLASRDKALSGEHISPSANAP